MSRVTAVGRISPTQGIDSIGNLPKLVWWFEPDTLVGTTSIDSWTDKSSAANTIAETGANRPTRAVAALDGYDGATVLAASNQRLSKDHDVIIPGRAFSWGLVVRVDTVVGDSRILSYDDVETTAGGFQLYVNGTKYNVTHNNVAVQDADTITAGTFRIITYRFSGSAVGFYRSARTRVALDTPTIGYSKPGATVGLCLGARNHTFTNPASCTYIASFGCAGFISDKQMKGVENYWKTKYPTLA